MDFKGRQRRLIQRLEALNIDALLVMHVPNVRYLTGFRGSAGAILVSPKTQFFTDGRYREQAKAQVQDARVVVGNGSAFAQAIAAAAAGKIRRLGIEAEHMSVASRRMVSSQLGRGVKIVDIAGAIENLRLRKDVEEVELVRRSVYLGSSLLKPLLRALVPGRSETDAAARLEFAARKAGAAAMSFETIVASGPRSALPHGVASVEPLPEQGFVVLDYGVILNGYCSDMTRTICLGRASERERQVYDAVLDAQLAATAAVRPGATAGEVDEAARSVLRRAKLDKYFTHSTGHGVGLEIHEGPRISAGQSQVLEPGMVITIEPGVYLPGKFGVRIEDMVLVTDKGHEVLTNAPKGFTTL